MKKIGKSNDGQFSITEKIAYCKALADSSLSISAFCKQHNIPQSTLYGWYKKYQRGQLQDTQQPEAGFIQLLPNSLPSTDLGILEAWLPSGIKLCFQKNFNLNVMLEILKGLKSCS